MTHGDTRFPEAYVRDTPIRADVAVIIPTFERGTLVFETLTRVQACEPPPAEIWVHIDEADGRLEQALAARFPDVHVIASAVRLGPGGGRNACLQRCTSPFVVSLDDDSYPVDQNFFAVVEQLFKRHPEGAVITAAIWHRNEAEIPLGATFRRQAGFTGCGHAIRLSDYRSIPGYVPRPVAYGLEETDVALQLFAQERGLFYSDALRVFHDTELKHHAEPEIVAGVVANAALLPFLRYPMLLWPLGAFQLMSTLRYCIGAGRTRGLLSGLSRIPKDCWQFRSYRRVQPAAAVARYVLSRRRHDWSSCAA